MSSFGVIIIIRKLADLGYHRNAKKCKEKFENVYKYHKRTKEGRSGKTEGKTYRFFDQLQALENNPAIHAIQSPTPPSKPPPVTTTPLPATPVSIVVTTTPSSIMSLPPTTTVPLPPVSNNATVPSTTTLPIPQAILALTTSSYPSSNPTTYFPTQTPNPTANNTNNKNPPSFPNIPTDLLSNSSSSSTSSEETTTEGGGARRKRKRKWKDFFERLMKEVIEKQEELQRRFLEAIEKREQERVTREESWRMQEMQRINREREILAQERSIAAAKDAAVMAFLQKMAEHQQEENNLQPALNTNNNNSITIASQQPVPQATPTPTPQQKQTTTVPETPPVQSLAPQPQQQQHQVQQQQQLVVTNVEINKTDNNGENLMMGASSSRWPKMEVQALIDLRTNLETKYQENGPKGPLWEEISSLMRKMGYNRNAKRCKEKWENINKYFKKVKESNKKRPEDSKTCPYFHQLEALYKEKNKVEGQMKPESMMAPLMVQPEQQWPPQQVVPPEITMEDAQNDPMDARNHEDAEEEEEDKEIADEDDDEDDEGGSYEIVASKPASAGDGSAE